MREIKFRAWAKVSRTMIAWEFVKEKIQNLFGNDEYILQQYTGLKDKNGVEIYEGDILEETTSDWGHRVVRYTDASFHAPLVKRHWAVDFNNILLSHSSLIKNGEVIGNIYENPELLDKE